jgi:hypothetical protein
LRSNLGLLGVHATGSSGFNLTSSHLGITGLHR